VHRDASRGRVRARATDQSARNGVGRVSGARPPIQLFHRTAQAVRERNAESVPVDHVPGT